MIAAAIGAFSFSNTEPRHRTESKGVASAMSCQCWADKPGTPSTFRIAKRTSSSAPFRRCPAGNWYTASHSTGGLLPYNCFGLGNSPVWDVRLVRSSACDYCSRMLSRHTAESGHQAQRVRGPAIRVELPGSVREIYLQPVRLRRGRARGRLSARQREEPTQE